MSLIFYWSNTTSLHPINITGRIGLGLRPRSEIFEHFGDLVDVLDSAFVTLISLRFAEAKDCRVLGVCPVRELVVAELEVLGFVGVIVLVDEPVPENESLQSNSKLLDFFINFVVASSIIHEIELVGTDCGSGRGEGGESVRFHR